MHPIILQLLSQLLGGSQASGGIFSGMPPDLQQTLQSWFQSQTGNPMGQPGQAQGPGSWQPGSGTWPGMGSPMGNPMSMGGANGAGSAQPRNQYMPPGLARMPQLPPGLLNMTTLPQGLAGRTVNPTMPTTPVTGQRIR